MEINKDQLIAIMPSLARQGGPYTVVAMLPCLNAAMIEFEIDPAHSALRTAAFLGQLAHESGELKHWEENLNYSWQGLRSVFRKYFPTDDEAKKYHRSPQRIANRVYSGRMGNGDEKSWDGWRYRGRSPIQLTGKDNYKLCGEALGLDLVSNPDLAASLDHGFRCAGYFWDSRGLNALADAEKFDAITKKINGGLNGKPERDRYYAKAKEVLGL